MSGYLKSISLIVLLSFSQVCIAAPSPAGIGWGNLIVPGLGATFRDRSIQGAIEAIAEIGLFFGATFGVSEGQFTIDTNILLNPSTKGNRTLLGPTLGQSFQQIGLKAHMFNTFYHYQQASIEQMASYESVEKLQPLYRGEWTDVLSAPFRWKNLKNPWVYTAILASLVGLALDYKTSTVALRNYRPTNVEQGLTAFNDIGLVPLGSAFGEEPLFRGFMQREFHSYTDNLWAAILMQTLVFAALHPEANRIPALAGGIYFGYLTHQYQGNIEPSVASHFWIDVISGVFDYFTFRLAHGDKAPFAPPVSLSINIPF
jgi:membrane protease YdiL (CAAX protease family)